MRSVFNQNETESKRGSLNCLILMFFYRTLSFYVVKNLMERKSHIYLLFYYLALDTLLYKFVMFNVYTGCRINSKKGKHQL